MMRAWIHYETVTTDEDGETVQGDFGILHPDGYRYSMVGRVGEPADYIKDQTAHEFRMASLADFETLSAWLLDTAGWPDHIENRGKTATIYRADAGGIDDDDPYVSAVTIEGTAAQVEGVIIMYRQLLEAW